MDAFALSNATIENRKKGRSQAGNKKGLISERRRVCKDIGSTHGDELAPFGSNLLVVVVNW